MIESVVPEKYYTVDEAAVILRVGAATVRTYIRSGKLKAYRPGGRVYRIRLVDIQAFIETEREGVI